MTTLQYEKLEKMYVLEHECVPYLIQTIHNHIISLFSASPISVFQWCSSFILPEIKERKKKGKINHIYFGVSVVAMTWWWKALKMVPSSSPDLDREIQKTFLSGCVSHLQTCLYKASRAHKEKHCLLSLKKKYWLHAFIFSLLPAAPSRLMTMMRCLTRRGCWLPKCTRVTSRTS